MINSGQSYADRKALHAAGVHRGLMQGIAPKGESIVLSGGYVDDIDARPAAPASAVRAGGTEVSGMSEVRVIFAKDEGGC